MLFHFAHWAPVFFCRSERQKCWSSCYRQWNFNLIMCAFMPPLAINHHWSFGHCSDLLTTVNPLKKYFLFVPNPRSEAVTQQRHCFRKVILTQNVDPAQSKSCPPFFYWLRLILPKFHAPLTNTTASHKVCVWSRCVPRLPRRQGQRRWPTGSLSGPLSDETCWTKRDAKKQQPA